MQKLLPFIYSGLAFTIYGPVPLPYVQISPAALLCSMWVVSHWHSYLCDLSSSGHAGPHGSLRPLAWRARSPAGACWPAGPAARGKVLGVVGREGRHTTCALS